MKKYVDEQMPNYFRMLENMLVFNKGGNGYFVGNKVNTAKRSCVPDSLR